MKNIILLILIGYSSLTFSQTIKQIDSVSFAMCDYLKQLEIPNDTLKLRTLYTDQFYPYLANSDSTVVDKVGQQLYYRLQRNCVDFRDLLDGIFPPKEASVRMTEKPTSEISRKDLKAFKKQENFYYFEVSGDTTQATMKDGFWIDSFADGTYSKLTYHWTDNTEFEMIFVESNNESRSNFSVKDDKLTYQVLAKEDDYYLMSVNIPGQATYEKFKVYYK